MRPQDIEKIATNVAGSFAGSDAVIGSGCGSLSSPIEYRCDVFTCSDYYECGEQAVFACEENYQCAGEFLCGCGEYESPVRP